MAALSIARAAARRLWSRHGRRRSRRARKSNLAGRPMERAGMNLTVLALFLTLVPAQPTKAQNTPSAFGTAATTAVSTNVSFGNPLDIKKGPWVIGDVLFTGNTINTTRDLELQVRARKGILYTPEDVDADAAALMDTGSFLKVTPAVYPIPDQPV